MSSISGQKEACSAMLIELSDFINVHPIKFSNSDSGGECPALRLFCLMCPSI